MERDERTAATFTAAGPRERLAMLLAWHTPGPTWRQKQSICALELGYTLEETAESVGRSTATVRRHIAEAEHRVFDPRGVAGHHGLLAKWAREHYTCCMQPCAELIEPVIWTILINWDAMSGLNLHPMRGLSVTTPRAVFFAIGAITLIGALVLGAAWLRNNQRRQRRRAGRQPFPPLRPHSRAPLVPAISAPCSFVARRCCTGHFQPVSAEGC